MYPNRRLDIRFRAGAPPPSRRENQRLPRHRAAGFIGSHLCGRLLALGHEVTGPDTFVPYFYPQGRRSRNLAEAKKHPKYGFFRWTCARDDLRPAVEGADVAYHLAAAPGLVAS